MMRRVSVTAVPACPNPDHAVDEQRKLASWKRPKSTIPQVPSSMQEKAGVITALTFARKAAAYPGRSLRQTRVGGPNPMLWCL